MENFQQLCVWPGTLLENSSIQDFENFFLNEIGVRIRYHKEEKTLPDINEFKEPILNTGGRNDIFFYVHSDDIEKFAIPRLQLGIMWWEDVFYNDMTYLYAKEFVNNHKPNW